MINPKWFWGLLILVFFLTILANIIEMSDPVSANNATVLSLLLQHETQTTSDISFLQNLSNIPSMAGEWIGAFWNAIWFDYNFLKGNFIGLMLRYIFIGLGFAFFLSFILYVFVRK